MKKHSSLGVAFVAAKSVKLYHNWEDINQLIGKHKIIYPQKIFKNITEISIIFT